MTHTERTEARIDSAQDAYVISDLSDVDAAILRCRALEDHARELAAKLDAVAEISEKLPDDLYVYRTFGGETKVQVKDGSAKSVIRAILEGEQ